MAARTRTCGLRANWRGICHAAVMPSSPLRGLQGSRPTVYLDQWVWIKLAQADNGTGSAEMESALQELRKAAASGVAFPLSGTHYSETLAITDPQQRLKIARTVASVSFMRTLRSPHHLVRHQLLTAMHEHIGRPAFRPPPIEVLHTGVHWAFKGEKVRGFVIKGPDGKLADVGDSLPFSLVDMNQYGEMRLLAGARDEDIESLRKKGYKPEAAAARFLTRVEFESDFAARLRSGDIKPKSSKELRVWIQAREVMHEHIDLLTELFAEYRISIEKTFGPFGKQSRQKMTRFFDAVPSVQVAVDLKTHLHRNQEKTWTANAVRDIDFLSAAVPYCDVVIADKEMTNLLTRSSTAFELGTTVVRKIADVVDLLPLLAQRAEEQGPDRTGWGGSTFCLDLPGFEF